jgi:hypothetical protein
MSLNEAADFQRKIYEFQKGVYQHIEMMAAAYMKATDVPPEECELVIETLPNKMVYRFQRRRTPTALDPLTADGGGGDLPAVDIIEDGSEPAPAGK